MESFFMIIALVISIFIGDTDCIMGGHRAYDGQFKYAASIWKHGYPTCSGGIIHISYVLTAGHCVDKSSERALGIVVGQVSFKSQTIRFQRVSRIIKHPDFKITGLPDFPGVEIAEHDIAVLRLKEPLGFLPSVQPVQLASDHTLCYCCVCVYAGWGMYHTASEMSSVMRWTSAIVQNEETCRKWRIALSENELCAYDPRGEAGVMSGDSGALLVCNEIAIGVVSGRTPAGQLTFRLIHPYVTFINDAIEGRL